MIKLEELLAQLRACAEELNEHENATKFKGPLIDAGIDLKLAIKHLEQHARNEARRAGAR